VHNVCLLSCSTELIYLACVQFVLHKVNKRNETVVIHCF